jgi:hypothetical protein
MEYDDDDDDDSIWNVFHNNDDDDVYKLRKDERAKKLKLSHYTP